MLRSDAGRQNVCALSRNVRGKGEKSGADQTQGTSLAADIADTAQLPHDDDRGADLDEEVQAESGKRNRMRGKGRDGKDEHPDSVPTQGDELEGEPPLEQPSGTDRHTESQTDRQE